jgi:hypothetical protein
MPYDLEKAVQEYWEVSQCYEGRSAKVTTEYAIRILGGRLQYMNPQRKLFGRAEALLSSIIEGADERPRYHGGKVVEFNRKCKQEQ